MLREQTTASNRYAMLTCSRWDCACSVVIHADLFLR